MTCVEGHVRYDGSDFYGCTGGAWVSLTGGTSGVVQSACTGGFNVGESNSLISDMTHGQVETVSCSEGGTVTVTCVSGAYVPSGFCGTAGNGDGGQ